MKSKIIILHRRPWPLSLGCRHPILGCQPIARHWGSSRLSQPSPPRATRFQQVLSHASHTDEKRWARKLLRDGRALNAAKLLRGTAEAQMVPSAAVWTSTVQALVWHEQGSDQPRRFEALNARSWMWIVGVASVSRSRPVLLHCRCAVSLWPVRRGKALCHRCGVIRAIAALARCESLDDVGRIATLHIFSC